MSRSAARAAAAAALTATGDYQAVLQGAVRNFQKQSPVAVVISRSLSHVREARALGTTTAGLLISVYVRVEVGDESAAEDQLDDLVETAVAELADAGFEIDQSDATPESAPLRLIDGVAYRVERVPIRMEEYD